MTTSPLTEDRSVWLDRAPGLNLAVSTDPNAIKQNKTRKPIAIFHILALPIVLKLGSLDLAESRLLESSCCKLKAIQRWSAMCRMWPWTMTYQKFLLCISSQGQDLYSHQKLYLLVLIWERLQTPTTMPDTTVQPLGWHTAIVYLLKLSSVLLSVSFAIKSILIDQRLTENLSSSINTHSHASSSSSSSRTLH